MTGSEVTRLFGRWLQGSPAATALLDRCYPLDSRGSWYVRERMPGTRVWRMEEDGSFTLLESDNWSARAYSKAVLG